MSTDGLAGFALGAITAGVIGFGAVVFTAPVDEQLPACQTPLVVSAVTR